MEAFRAMDGSVGDDMAFGSGSSPAAVTPLPHETVVDLGGPSTRSAGSRICPATDARRQRQGSRTTRSYLSDRPENDMRAAGREHRQTRRQGGVHRSLNGRECRSSFDAPVKGRYFRLRALSNVTGRAHVGRESGSLKLHCKGVKFVGQSWALAKGELRLPKVIGSHMVLQRDVGTVHLGMGQEGPGRHGGSGRRGTRPR